MILVCLTSASIALAQQTQERVIKKMNRRNEPLAIFNLQVDGKPTSFDEKFAAGEDWAKGVSIDIKYISGKVITHFEISLRLPALQKDKPGGEVLMMFHGSNTTFPGVEPTVRMAPRGALIPSSHQIVSLGDAPATKRRKPA
jgi:hypothetical protein